MKWLTVFAVTALYDWVWAKYTYAIAHKSPLYASAYSGIVFALGGYVIVTYTGDHLMLAPAVAGAIVGTYVAVRR